MCGGCEILNTDYHKPEHRLAQYCENPPDYVEIRVKTTNMLPTYRGQQTDGGLKIYINRLDHSENDSRVIFFFR